MPGPTLTGQKKRSITGYYTTWLISVVLTAMSILLVGFAANQASASSHGTEQYEEAIHQADKAIEADELLYRHHISLAASTSQNDDWQLALQHYNDALQIYPHDQLATERLAATQRIIDITSQLVRSLGRESTLSIPEVADSVTKQLHDAEPYLLYSTRLQEVYAELAEKRVLYQKETFVTVISDNLTDIIVRGIGIIGKTNRRVIRLKPGNYKFEGSRIHYRSTIVPLLIEPGSLPVVVKVVCSERI